MRSKNNIHVQQHKINMINEEWNKTQNDAFYDMRAVTFVLADEMADVSIAGLQWFILIPRLNHRGSHRSIDSHSKPYLHRRKKRQKPRGKNKNIRQQNLRLLNINPFPLNDTFWRVWERSLYETLWEKEKMLVTSIFSFSHNVFYSIKDRYDHLCYIYFVACKCFQFEQGQIFGNGLKGN